MNQEINLVKIFAFICSMTLFFTAMGWAIGNYIGTNMPDYYRVMFQRRPDEPAFDPVQVGVGLGITQGAISGMVISIVVVIGVFVRAMLPPRSNRPAPPTDTISS